MCYEQNYYANVNSWYYEMQGTQTLGRHKFTQKYVIKYKKISQMSTHPYVNMRSIKFENNCLEIIS